MTPVAQLLLVEDDAEIRRGLMRGLAELGHAVVGVASGYEALKEIVEQRPDLVVLDLDLPVASGFRVLEVLKGDPATAAVPVLVVTALDFAEAKAAAQAGADAFLTKPFDAAELAARAERLLAGAGTAPA